MPRHFKVRSLSPLGLLLTLCAIGVACAGTPKKATTSVSPSSPGEAPRSIDDPPLTDRELTGKGRQNQPSAPLADTTPPDTGELEPPVLRREGFRIQVFSFQDREAAIQAQKKVQANLKDTGVKVYLDEEAPYYKIRVGDYSSRTEAESALRLLKTSAGYRDAWIVKALVY